jgi:hypothetical protein
VRRAPKLPVHKVVRLYELDAAGIQDDDALLDVGRRLLDRCHSVFLYVRGRVERPECGAEVIVRPDAPDRSRWWESPRPGERNGACPRCGWTITFAEFAASARHRELGAPLEAVRDLLDRYPRADGYVERLVIVDRLIDTLHATGSMALRNFFEGRWRATLDALNRLAASPDGHLRRRHVARERGARAVRGSRGITNSPADEGDAFRSRAPRTSGTPAGYISCAAGRRPPADSRHARA